MAANNNRIGITLACTECKQRNYQTTKNKKNDSGNQQVKASPRGRRTQRIRRYTQTHSTACASKRSGGSSRASMRSITSSGTASGRLALRRRFSAH